MKAEHNQAHDEEHHISNAPLMSFDEVSVEIDNSEELR